MFRHLRRISHTHTQAFVYSCLIRGWPPHTQAFVYSCGIGGALARYAAEGVETHLVCATRGERGWPGPEADNPGLAALGRLRESPLLGLPAETHRRLLGRGSFVRVFSLVNGGRAVEHDLFAGLR